MGRSREESLNPGVLSYQLSTREIDNGFIIPPRAWGDSTTSFCLPAVQALPSGIGGASGNPLS